MTATSLYLIEMLKRYDAESIVTLFRYESSNQLVWTDEYFAHIEDKSSYKQVCLFGISKKIGSRLRTTAVSYLSSKPNFYGYGIHFEYHFNHAGTFYTPISKIIGNPANEAFLDNIFMQMLAISEKHSIYLNCEPLIEKGSAYEHLLKADLNKPISF